MFPEKLKQARKKAQLSQKELASKLNIKQQSYAAWETGKATPRQKRLEEISNILNISISELLEDASDNDLSYYLQKSTTYKKIQLTDKHKKEIETLIEAYLKGTE